MAGDGTKLYVDKKKEGKRPPKLSSFIDTKLTDISNDNKNLYLEFDNGYQITIKSNNLNTVIEEIKEIKEDEM